MEHKVIQRSTKYEAEFLITKPQYDADTYQGHIYLPFGVVLRGDEPKKGKRLRLAGLDADEVRRIRGATAEDVIKGKESRDLVRKIMPVGSWLRFESLFIEKYGRILAIVWSPIPEDEGVDDHPMGFDEVDLMSFKEGEDPTHFNVNQWLIASGRAKSYMQDTLSK